MCITKERVTQDPSPTNATPNPYVGKKRHPELERILQEADSAGGQPGVVSSVGEQEDGGEEGEEDDLLGDGDYNIPAHAGKSSPSPLKPIAPGVSHNAPLGSLPPPSPSNTTVATAAGAADLPPTGVYDGLAHLHPDAIIDKNYLAKAFGVGEKTIRRRIAAGELPPPSEKLGRCPGWVVGVLRDWLKDRAQRIAEQEDARRRRIVSQSK